VRVACVDEPRPPLDVLLILLLFAQRASSRKIPRVHVHRRIVLDVPHETAALEDERLQALLAQLFGHPSSADA
jgi:hypothetical protein